MTNIVKDIIPIEGTHKNNTCREKMLTLWKPVQAMKSNPEY